MANPVFIIQTSSHASGVKALLAKFNLSDFSGKHVALKANFNSADPFPASSHLDTVQAIVEALKAANVSGVTLGERSGMGNTQEVLETMGVLALADKIGFQTVILDNINKGDWVKVERDGTHWLHGFYIAKMFSAAEKMVETCCLKAHRFGGHFTLSLKNSVGLVAKRVPGSLYDYMWELHGSPFQRQMIAEINRHYCPDVVIMDGVEAFTDGGPEKGTLVEPKLMLASKDRVAIDAVGVAILRSYGSTHQIMKGPIFELDPIKRACELGIGAKSAQEIVITPLNEETKPAAEKLANILTREG